jgi:phage tail-like protein
VPPRQGPNHPAGAEGNPLADLPHDALAALFPPAAPAEARREALHPPSPAAVFRVLIGQAEIDVARVAGLSLAADPAGLRAARSHGGVAWSAPPLPLRVTLARALDGDRRLYAWRREAILEGAAASRSVEIRQLDRDGRQVLNAWLLQGWPLRWTGPEFDANGGGLAWETLEIVAHDLIWLEESDGHPT